MADDISFDSYVDNYRLCESFYKLAPVIPSYGEDGVYRLISSSLEFIILSFILSVILRKKYYIYIKNDHIAAKSILLPFYDRIMYYYLLVTISRLSFAIIEYMLITYSSSIDTIENSWWIVLIEIISYSSLIGLEIFILFLLVQTSVGKNAFKRAFIYTVIMLFFQIIVITIKHFLGDKPDNFAIYGLCEVLIHSSLLLLYITTFLYSCVYQQHFKNRIRLRDKILYVYLLCLSIMDSILLISFILLLFHIDSWCFIIIDQYFYRIFFPFIIYFTIKKDSEFWAKILFKWQISSSSQSSIKRNTVNKSISNSFDSATNIQSVFGRGDDNDNNYYDPLIDALSMDVEIIDFKQLHEISEPIGMGATAMVSKAKLDGKDVAVKIFIFDELSLEIVQEFFRETLLINNINHKNIVQFKGACLRPPDLCLIYEYCSCGDLAHLMLTQYFNKGFNYNKIQNNINYKEAKLLHNRLLMLIDISRGMLQLHDYNIIHRDLKTSNILVHYDKIFARKYCAKVCDFGSARKLISSTDIISSDMDLTSVLNNNNQMHMTTNVGTIAFMAPEILTNIDVFKKKRNNIYNNDIKDEYKSLEMAMSQSVPPIINNSNSNIINPQKLRINSLDFISSNINIVIDEKYNNEYNIKYDDNHHETQNISINNNIIYDKSVDVYGFGVIMWEIGFFMRIYDDMDLNNIYSTVCYGKRMNIISHNKCQNNKNSGFYAVDKDVYDAYINLLNDCWSQIPNKRPTFDEIEDRLNAIYELNQLKTNKIYSIDI